MSKKPSPTILFHAAVGVTLELFVAPVARALGAHGFRRVAVAGQGSLPAFKEGDFDVVREITSFRGAPTPRIARAAADLARIMRTERVNLLHVHSPYGIAIGRLAARATRTPHIAVVHGTLFGQRTRSGRLFSAAESAAARLTKTYVTLNPDDRDAYRRLAPKSRIHLAPCGGAGIDFVRLHGQSAQRRAADQPPRVLVMCRLTQDKNLDLAVSAWRLAKKSIPNLELRIVGSAAPGEPAWEPPHEPGVVLMPWTSQPGVELAAADVLLSTSLREGFPMTLAEALALGTPVVAVDNRGSRTIADLVHEGLALVPARPAAVSSALLSQLRARTVNVSASVLGSWEQDVVVDFHVARILEAVDRNS